MGDNPGLSGTLRTFDKLCFLLPSFRDKSPGKPAEPLSRDGVESREVGADVVHAERIDEEPLEVVVNPLNNEEVEESLNGVNALSKKCRKIFTLNERIKIFCSLKSQHKL